jgi:hypothetical protein
MENNFRDDLMKVRRRFGTGTYGAYRHETNTYEYINVGNDVELDYFSFKPTEGILANIHLRNQKTVSESSLADMLVTFRSYFISQIDALELSSGTMGFLNELFENYPDLHFRVISVVIDPGFKAHVSIEKDMGIRLASAEIWFNNVFNDDDRICDFLKDKMNLKTFIFEPQEYLDKVKFTKPQVDLLNEKLFLLSNKSNQHKKFDILMKQFLKGGQTRLALELPGEDGNTYGKSIEVSWQYIPEEGGPPYVHMSVEHGNLYNNEKGILWGWIRESGNKGGTFVIQLPENTFKELNELNIPFVELEDKIKESFKYYMSRYLDTIHMNFDIDTMDQIKVQHS